jgi:hypothetical protein
MIRQGDCRVVRHAALYTGTQQICFETSRTDGYRSDLIIVIAISLLAGIGVGGACGPTCVGLSLTRLGPGERCKVEKKGDDKFAAAVMSYERALGVRRIVVQAVPPG